MWAIYKSTIVCHIFYHNFIYKMLSYAMERAKKWWNLFCIVRNDQFEWFMWSKQELSCANCGHHIIQSENFKFICNSSSVLWVPKTAWKDAKLIENYFVKSTSIMVFYSKLIWRKNTLQSHLEMLRCWPLLV